MNKNFYNILFYTILIMGYAVFAILMSRAYKEVDRQSVSNLFSERSPTIIIDPGHGGEDDGAVAEGGKVSEKDLNLEISKILRDMFKSSGFNVEMTRDTDISIYDRDKNLKSLSEKKTSDLNNRVKIAQNNPNSVLISIHQNSHPDKFSKGTEIFYSPNNKLSEEFAFCLEKIFKKIQPNNKREVKNSKNFIFILKKVTIPAVMVECGFISNYKELLKLKNFDYQKQIAFCIYCAYVEYCNNFYFH
ncbi:MAG: N-acetylmuramoyl-L-alanine amidase [Oscillospiraceae bacterium]|jgi:N-acetylmuramoyl-L-alanine amidase|nr:N-acetylmuramoyl-L-alanine amidase [Oscillospiraceae bacterium]